MKNLKLLVSSLITVTILFSLSACQESQPQAPEIKAEIEIIQPWLRDLPKGSLNSAGFMTIVNNSDNPLILQDVSLDWAHHVMLHQSKVVDGMAKMIHQDEILIESQLEFKPGGLHIMIMGLEEPLKEGQSYNIRLHFKGREPLEVEFKVGQAKP